MTNLDTTTPEIAPGPWRVGERPTRRSMFPIRDANGKVVCYTPSEVTANLLVQLRLEKP